MLLAVSEIPARLPLKAPVFPKTASLKKFGSSGIFVARGGRFGDFDGVECRDGNTLCALCPIARDR